MVDIRFKDLNEATVPGADYWIPSDSATDGVKKIKPSNLVTPADIGAGATASTLAQFAATTSAELAGVISDETGSGALVFATSPTLVTPTLGVAAATSINKVAVTAPTTGATLTIADGKTLTASDDATVSGTNTGDQTITLTGDVTGTGTGTFAATIGATKVTSAMLNADVFSTAHSWGGVQTFANPVVGTQTAGDNSTKAASTAFVAAAVVAAGGGGSVTSSLIDPFRGGLVSPELFTLTNGVNEFDLLKVGSTYYLAHDDKTTTQLLSASTIAGLGSATPYEPVTGLRVPTIYYDAGTTTWHLWGGLTSDSNNAHHYTSSTFGGTYTDTGDTFPSGYGDIHVRKLSNGVFYMAYIDTTLPARKMGVMTASSVSGPWTDLGEVFSVLGRAGTYAGDYADPAIFETDGRAYISFAAWDGNSTTVQYPVMAEIDMDTGKAISPVVAVANPYDASWSQRNSAIKLFNPVFFQEDGIPDRIYYSHNVGTTGVASGWGYTEANAPPLDNRRVEDALNIDLEKSTMNIANMIPATFHGSTTWLPRVGLVLTSTTGGAYGALNVPGFTDFTVLAEFTIDTLPADGVYQTVVRFSKFTEGKIVGLWVTSTAGVKTIYYQIGDTTGVGTKVLTTGVRYRVVISLIDGAYKITVNGTSDATGSDSTDLSGMEEWAVGNRKGAITAASLQFVGKIHRALIVSGPMRRTGDI